MPKLFYTILTTYFITLCLFSHQAYAVRVLNPHPIPSFTVPAKDKDGTYLECLVYGDAGTGARGQKLIAAVMAQHASRSPFNFAISLGDNFYNSGVHSIKDIQWKTKFFNIYDYPSLDIPFYMLLGNHDYRRNPQAQVNYPHPKWKMPGRYYSFTKKLENNHTVQFFALDTTPIDRKLFDNQPQLKWLENALKNSKATWKVVMGHHPLYSGGGHGINPKMIQTIGPMLKKYQVDLYLSGHDHDQQLLFVNDIYFMISGNSGGARNVKWLPKTMFAATDLGYSSLRISSKSLTLFFYNKFGELRFSHTLNK